MKKFISVILSLTLIFSNGLSLFASDTLNEENSNSNMEEQINPKYKEWENTREDAFNNQTPITDEAIPSRVAYTDSLANDGISLFSTSTDDQDSSHFFHHDGDKVSFYSECTSNKEQGNTTFSAWIFSAISAYETKLIRNGYENTTTDLSEEHCRQSIMGSTPYDYIDRDYRFSGDMNGPGNFDMAYTYFTRGMYNGVVGESSELPYLTDSKKSLNYLQQFVNKGYYPTKCVSVPDVVEPNTANYVDKLNRIDKIRKLIKENGSVIVTIPLDDSCFTTSEQDPNNTNYYLPTYDPTLPTTMVELIGWDDILSNQSFATPSPHHGAFVAKKSWPNNTCDEHMYIAFDNVAQFTDVRCITNMTQNWNKSLYEHDTLGEGASVTTAGAGSVIVNKFTKKSNNVEQLENVYVAQVDSAIKFKVLISSTGKFADLQEVEIIDTQKDNNGYYSFDQPGKYVVTLKTPITLTASNFLVGLKLDSDSNIAASYPFECDYQWSYVDKYDNYTTKYIGGHSSCHQNESFWCTNISDYKQDSYKDVGYIDGWNWCIKAYTKDLGCTNFDNSKVYFNLATMGNSNESINSSVFLDNKVEICANASNVVRLTDAKLGASFDNTNGYATLNNNFITDDMVNGISFVLSEPADIYLTAQGDTNVSLYSESGEVVDSVRFEETANTLRFKCSKSGKYYIGINDIAGKKIEIQKIQAAIYTNVDTSSIDKVWNFSNEPFNSYGSFSGEKSYDGLAMKGSFSMLIDFETPFKTYYKRSLKIENSGNFDNNYISFYSPSNTDIYFNGKSYLDSGTRNIVIFNQYGQIYSNSVLAYDRLSVENENSFMIHYDGPGETLYMASLTGKVELYEIGVETTNNDNSLYYKSWNFDTPQFYDSTGGEASHDFGGLILTTMDENSAFKTSDITVDNVTYRKYYSLSGEWTNSTSPSIMVKVPGRCIIKIVGKASDNQSEPVCLVDEKHHKLLSGNISNNTTPSSYYVQYDGAGGWVSLKSLKGSHCIYSIELIRDDNIGTDISLPEDTYTIGSEIAKTIEDKLISIEDTYISGSAVSITEEEKQDVIDNNVEQTSEMVMGEVQNELETVEKITESITQSNAEETYVQCELTPEVIQNINKKEDSIFNAPVSALSLNNNEDVTDGKNWYKFQLTSDEELNIYNQLVEAFVNKQSTENITFVNVDLKNIIYDSANIEVSKKILRNAISAFFNDHPEAFWINYDYKFEITKLSKNGESYIVNIGAWFTRNTSVGSIKNLKNIIIPNYNSLLQSLLDNIDNNKVNSYEKIEAIYNSLKSSITYMHGTAKNNAYSGLTGNASCSGISKALKAACDEIGVLCVIGVGKYNDSSAEHMCNYIKVNGEWYMCDLTNDLMNNINEYFMIPVPEDFNIENPTYYNNTLEFQNPICAEVPPIFNAKWYAAQNPDVVNIFGTKEETLYNHWLNYGINEGRNPSPIYDFDYYYNNNPDLRTLFGNDAKKFYVHFIQYGMDEGRQASSQFNVINYMNNNPSLNVFGNKLSLYYSYFSQHCI